MKPDRRIGSCARSSARLVPAALLAVGALLGVLFTAAFPAEAPGSHKCKHWVDHPGEHSRRTKQCRPPDEKPEERVKEGDEVKPTSTAVRYVPGELLVRFRATASEAERREAAERAGGAIVDHLPPLGLHVVEVAPGRTEEAFDSLRSSPAVGGAERDVYLESFDTTPNDSLWPTQWGWRVIGAPRAWDSTRGAPGIVVAVLDTGVDSRHPDLEGATVSGYDFANGDSDPADDEGHGTSAAGVIAARSNNGQGQAGVCWECSLMPVKVLDGRGSGKTSAIAAGIVWAVDRGARVLNMSLGGPGTTSALASAIEYASSKGAVLVASAGNSGDETRFYPAAYDGVLAVAGTTESDELYEWSNRGSWVQLAAPGCNTATDVGGSYVQFCGTSAAAPMVAGVAALALSLRPGASKAEIEEAIRRTATSLPSGVRFGRVNAGAAISLVMTGTQTPLAPPQPAPAAPAEPAASPAAPAAPPAAPASSSPPVITGVPRVGLALTAASGAWSGASPLAYAYSWLRCNRRGLACRSIAAASRQVYAPALADVGGTLRVRVTVTNTAGAAVAESAATAPVTVPRPVNVRRPRVLGFARVGRVLHAAPGSWRFGPVRIAYRWQQCTPSGRRCRTISAAGRRTYRLPLRARGSRVRVVVIAANRMGSTKATTGFSSVVRGARRNDGSRGLR